MIINKQISSTQMSKNQTTEIKKKVGKKTPKDVVEEVMDDQEIQEVTDEVENKVTVKKNVQKPKSKKIVTSLRVKPKSVAKKLKKVDDEEIEKVRHVHKKVPIEIGEDNKFELDDLASVEYYDNFLTKKFHDELFKELSDEVPWTQGEYNMYGHAVKTPRLLYCMRDKDFDVTKVYKVTESMVWTKNMLKLKKMVEKKTNKKYSYAQLNYYRTGDDYIGYHTDSEVQDGDVIASISLGATRKFTFRQIDYKDNDSDIYVMDLEGGSLILMNEYAAKKRWKHELPKMKDVEDVRINITFRPK